MTRVHTIGVFDSGVGGLTVLASLRSKLPGHNFVYLGDTARVPYGPKSEQVVRHYAYEAAWFLRKQGADSLVIACNSASAAAREQLRTVYPDIPVFDVIDPGASAAVAATRNKRVGVIGTRGTIASGKYGEAISRIDPTVDVVSVPCPLFVPLAEEGEGDSDIARTIARKYLALIIEAGCDVVLLGCTHYPLLKKVIQDCVGENVVVVDSAQPLADLMKEQLPQSETTGGMRLFTTDAPERFTEIGRQFLGSPVPDTKKVDLEAMMLEERERTGSSEFLTQGSAK